MKGFRPLRELTNLPPGRHRPFLPSVPVFGRNPSELRGGKTSPAPKPPMPEGFYSQRAWLELRYVALRRSNGKCEACGASKATGAVLHVDHIKPRSKYPKLELDLSNLQVLCADCNIGKSNKDETDWRSETP